MRVLSQREETAIIRANRASPAAAKPHLFKPAQWTLPDGRRRCLICGQPEPKGRRCPGLGHTELKKDQFLVFQEDPWSIPFPEVFLIEAPELELALGLPQVFASPGGKRLAAKKIVSLLPPHVTYVEPFCGSAAVFWAKTPSAQEVLGDTREGLIDTLRWIRDTQDFEGIFHKDWRPSRETWEKLSRWHPHTPLDKAYRFLWLSRCSLMNQEAQGYSPVIARRDLHPPPRSRFPKWHERLQGVTLLQQDGFRTIREFDSPYTVFYLDPPYPRGVHANLYPGHSWSAEDVEKLIRLLKSLKGKFLLSLNWKSVPKHLPANFEIRKIRMLYPSLPTSVKGLRMGRESSYRFEVLIHNYSLPGGD